ncbi:hypothetical protein [Methylobacterium sp. C1]|uniref:hypothetical protein n=1 Tax=Methylobacterium sp. C1 TaxID=1479019 RepID=UPI0008DA2D62|nr:hypothetical protein [Methylobacterium sp. C1]
MVDRPVPGNTGATLNSINQLCDAADLAAAAIADFEARLGVVQAAVSAEVAARRQAVSGEAQARGAAVATESQARQQAVTGEANARVAAIQQEQQDRGAAIASAAQDLGQRISDLRDSLGDALRAETQARTAADAAEQKGRVEAITAQAKALTDAVANLEAQISTKASTDDLTAAGAAQAKALADAVAAIRVVTDGISATIAAQRLDFVAYPGRPGDAPVRYTFVTAAAALAGSRAALPLIPPAMLAGTENGPVVRVDGAGIVAGRAACPLEDGRLYRARYVVQRRANPADPSGDAVVCGLVFLDQSLRVLGSVMAVKAYPALTTAFGRQECEALVSRSAGLGEAFVAPPRARFMVPVVATFGPDALTDVEVLNLEDVTGSFVLAPPPDGLEARLTALVVGLAARVQALESEAGNPSKRTFESRGDAAAATIPESVQVVELLGRRFAGDGGGGLFARVGGDPAPGAETFTSNGAVFQRVRALPDVAAATLDAGFPTFVGALPSEPPPTSGTAWNNAGAPVLTP